MKRLIILINILVFAGIILFLGECGFHRNETGEGSLMLTISQKRFDAKTIQPPVVMEIEYYIISGEGLGGAQLEEVLVGVNDSPVEIGPLTIGDWTINVQAWNDQDGNGEWDSAADKWIGWGSTTVKIKAREQAEATVEVRPRTDEPGSLRVTLSWDVGLLSEPAVTGTLTHVSGSPVYEIDLTMGDGITEDEGMYVAIYEETGLYPGYYSLLVYLNDEGQAVWGAFEAVRILAEWESIYDQEIGPGDISPGGIDIGIEPDLQNPVQVTLEGVQDIVPPVDQITVTVLTEPADTDSYEYRWYVNGIYQQEVEGSEITIGRIGSESDIELLEGNYRLDVGVLSGETISSGTACFSVSTEPAATYSISGHVSYNTGSGVIGFREVTMTLSGDASGTITTDESGNYVFSGIADGSYTLTPSMNGYTFNPAASSVTVASADVTNVDFTATGPAYSISGFVQSRIGGVSGVEMTLDTTPPLTVTSVSWGSYTTASVPNGTYTLTPSLTGSNVAFYPPEKILTVAGANLTDENFQTTFIYTVSGTVSYSGSKSGWVYINAIDDWGGTTGVGTSIEVTGSGSWDFTVRGVQSGTYTLTAHMDNLGIGDPHPSNPSGSSETFTVVDSDIMGQTITLIDPPPVTPEVPAIMAVFPSNQSAWLLYESPSDENEDEIAQSYNVYWSKEPDMSNIEGMGSFPVNDMDLYIASGLDDGEAYYFVITAVADSTESGESEIFGPVTIGAAEGNYTVSGTITLSQMATGPMYVLIYGETEEDLVACATYIASPSSSQFYSISGVPDGTYMFAVLVDMNDNGIMDWIGDISIGFEGESEIEVSGTTIHDLTIGFVPNALVDVYTSHEKYNGWEGYSLNFEVNGWLKNVAKASLMSGPNIPGIIDISCMQEHEERISLSFYSTSPGVGDTYSFDLTYADGTTESLEASVTAVIESFATPITPIESNVPGGTHPIFTWAHPDSPPAVYTYEISVGESMGQGIWWTDNIPSSLNSVEFNFDGEAEQDPLTPGTTYSWWIGVEDSNGNTGRSGSVEFTP